LNEKYLSDLDITSRLKSNVVNIVYAPVGSGKTTWVNKNLVETVDNKWEILYLIDTTAGRDQIINDNIDLATTHCDHWENWLNRSGREIWGILPTPINKVPVMTFSKLAHAIKRNGGLGVGQLKHIILDECQNLKIFQSYGDENSENVLELLEYWLKFLLGNTDIKITALSATPRKIYDMFHQNQTLDILADQEKASLRTLNNGITRQYVSIHNILSNLPQGKIVIYTPRITDIKTYADIIKSRDNRNVEMIWSRNNPKHPLSTRQLEIWDSILKTATIPADVDILFYNASCLTGVNIKSHVDYVIVHDKDVDNQTQARGRVRNDIKGLYVPYNQIIHTQEPYIIIPENFINRPLYKADKEELATAANVVIDGHAKKFPTISKFIQQSPEYSIEKHRTRKGGIDKEYHIIERTRSL
jgi:hypothetical protein